MAMAEEFEDGQDEVSATSPLASVPSFGGRAIDPYEEMDAVVEGSEEAAALEQEPPELAGKTKEDLFGQLKSLQEELTASKAANDPVRALGTSLQEALRSREPPVQMAPQVPQESPEQRRSRLNALWLEDPIKASEEMAKEQLRPLVDMMLSSTTALSKDLALTDPGQKTIYDRYTDEVEREVSIMNPVEKAQNPRVYQAAIQRVRARHTDDLVSTMVEEAVQKRLRELGIDTNKLNKPAVYSPAGQPRTAQKPTQGRQTVVIPRWVVQDADRQGLDPKFYYQHLKESGRLDRK